MIDFIEGKLESKGQGEVVINAGGVGFVLSCSNTTIAEAPAKGENWRCYSVLNVKEDAMDLYGFATKQERAMFRRLCMVNGIGSKTALGILSSMPLRDLSVAILTGDATALSRAPGVGKKTAQRILLELKDKLEQNDVDMPAGVTAAEIKPASGSAEQEAQAALQALGYSTAEAARAINQVRDQAKDVNSLIMLALKYMGS